MTELVERRNPATDAAAITGMGSRVIAISMDDGGRNHAGGAAKRAQAAGIPSGIDKTGESAASHERMARYRALQRIDGGSVIPQQGGNRRPGIGSTSACRSFRRSLSLHGDSVPKPLGFIAFGPTGFCLARGRCPAPVGTQRGAQVASLQSPILRLRRFQYKRSSGHSRPQAMAVLV